MANDIQDRISQILGSDSARALAGTAFNEALKSFGGSRSSNGAGGENSHRGLSGVKGLAAGAGAAAVAPIAARGIGKLIKGNGAGALASGPKKLADEATSKLGDTLSSKAKEKVDEAGGPAGILKDSVKSALPFGGGGGGGGGKNDAEGVGKGRRMPVQQSVDIALPLETVYNQWTQFEEWPKFMHRVKRVSHDDPCKVSFAVKIWGKTKEFTAEIETQRPDDRIKWKTTQGMNHSGVVAFRELGPNLTRVLLSFDLDPGGPLEKYARGARYVKRAARADLHRFVAFIEMLEHETGAWRGVIEDGEVVEDHDPSYDKKREYASADELVQGRGSEEDEEDEDEDEDDDHGRNGGEPRASSQRGRSQSRSRQSSGSSKAQTRRSGSSSRSSSRGGSSRSGSGTRSSGSRSSGSSARSSGSSGRSSGSSARSSGSSARSSGSSARSSGSSARSSGSSGRSSSGRSSGSRSSGNGRSSGSSSGRSSSSGSGSRSSGRTRSSGGSGSSRSSAAHQGRQRTRSSRSS